MNLVLERKDGIGRITLNRPDVRNAFDDALIAALTSAFADMDKDASIRVVVLAGNGPAFCAGADLNWMKRMAGYGYDDNLRDARALAEMLATLDRLDKPTIARVHGPAFAGGTGLVAACDIAVGTPEAKFCFSEAKLGLSPATISPYVNSFIEALTQHLLAGGGEAHARIKDLIRDVAGRAVDDALKADTARRIAEIRSSPEGREGIASFLEKRKPSWKR